MKDYALNRGGLTDAVTTEIAQSRGVTLAVRSQPRSNYPRHVCLQGRTEPCSVSVNDGYNSPRVSCSERRLRAESMTESKDRQERS